MVPPVWGHETKMTAMGNAIGDTQNQRAETLIRLPDARIAFYLPVPV